MPGFLPTNTTYAAALGFLAISLPRGRVEVATRRRCAAGRYSNGIVDGKQHESKYEEPGDVVPWV